MKGANIHNSEKNGLLNIEGEFSTSITTGPGQRISTG